jgi:hypothetical protein
VKRSITSLLVGTAAVAALALTGCSAGLNSQTADAVAAVPGVNVTAVLPSGQGSVSVRDAVIAYPGIGGYKAGANAPLATRIFNDTTAPVKVTITTDPAVATGVALVNNAKTAPSASATPAATPSATTTATPTAKPAGATPSATPAANAPAAPATVTIPFGSFVVLDPAVGPYVQLVGLKRPLANGDAVELTFTFSNGAVIVTKVSIAPPLSPVPRSPLHFEEKSPAGESH